MSVDVPPPGASIRLVEELTIVYAAAAAAVVAVGMDFLRGIFLIKEREGDDGCVCVFPITFR